MKHLEKSSIETSVVQLSPLLERKLLALVMILSAIFRGAAACLLSLSNDELSALTRARYDSFHEMITKGVFIDFHPAGVESFIYYWIKLFGDDPFVYRLPFVLSGLLSTWLIFALGKRWFSSFTGLFAASVFSVFQFSVLYSFFARPYSPGLLAGLLAAYSWTILFFDNHQPEKKSRNYFCWAIFIFSMIACTHTHYFSFVFAAGLGLTGLFYIKRDLLRPYIFSGILILIAFLPEWHIFKEQIRTGDIGGWLAAPGSWYLPKFILHIFNDSLSIAISLFILVLPGLIIIFTRRGFTKFHLFSLLWFLFSFLIAYAYSLWRHPIIQFSTMYFTFPFLLFILGHAIENVFSRWKKSYLLIPMLLLIGTLHTVYAKGLFSRAQYGVFKDIAEDLREWNLQMKSENIASVVNVINPEYLNYYFRRMDFHPENILWKIEQRNQLNLFANNLDSLNSKYFCFAWTNAEHPFEIIRMLRTEYPVLLKKKVYFNSAAYLFAKTGTSVCAEPLFHFVYDVAEHSWNSRASEPMDAEQVLKIDTMTEFSPGFQKKVKELPGENFRIITVNLDFRSNEKISNASLVISYDSAGVPLEYYSLALDECNPFPGKWQKVFFSQVVPEKASEAELLNIYIYNKDKRNFDLKNYEVTLENWDDPYPD